MKKDIDKLKLPNTDLLISNIVNEPNDLNEHVNNSISPESLNAILTEWMENHINLREEEYKKQAKQFIIELVNIGGCCDCSECTNAFKSLEEEVPEITTLLNYTLLFYKEFTSFVKTNENFFLEVDYLRKELRSIRRLMRLRGVKVEGVKTSKQYRCFQLRINYVSNTLRHLLEQGIYFATLNNKLLEDEKTYSIFRNTYGDSLLKIT